MNIGNITSDNFNLDSNGKDIQIEVYEQLIEQLQQENKQLKENWNKLKEYIDIKLYNVEYLQKLCGCRIDDEIHMILDIIKKEIQELEQGSGSDE